MYSKLTNLRYMSITICTIKYCDAILYISFIKKKLDSFRPEDLGRN